ncbi:MAG: tRNA preQ1(34) S-adenosylmethionine ribosyltransferase-isomerase QueA [Wolinella sp.]
MIDPFLLESYNYELPGDLIARFPIKPKNMARLLVYKRKDGSITHTCFNSFEDFIPRDSLLVLNDTKVIKARFYGRKDSGGAIELLYHEPLLNSKNPRFLVQIGGRVKKGQKILLERGFSAQICELLDGGFREVEFFDERGCILGMAELFSFLDSCGHVPLPPYIKRDDTNDDELDYQNPFAANAGAIAAPTASLHFENSEAERLKANFNHAYVTLHVGAGTFLGVECKDIRAHKMHREHFFIPSESAKKIEESQQILAIGTTAARTVEHYARTKECEGECELFLHHGNPPQKTTALLTNFHLPKSTLLMLVGAFIGVSEMQRIYAEAIAHRYRFYSYGDGMLIL